MMKIIHRQMELSTLKHSRYVLNLALKHSRLCAETLPHSIYTYSYLYKNTCSKVLIIVDNFLKKQKSYLEKTGYKKLSKNILSIVSLSVIGFTLAGCQKTIHFSECKFYQRGIMQKPATKYQPAKFYICGDGMFPCPQTNSTQPKGRKYEN